MRPNREEWPGGRFDDAMFLRYALFAMFGLWIV